MSTDPVQSGPITRREFVAAGTAGAAAAVSVLGGVPSATAAGPAPPEDYRASKGRIKHSVMAWCFDAVPKDTLIAACQRMGLSAMEGIGREFYPKIRAAGMRISLVGSHGFAKGPFNRDHHADCIKALREGIDLAVQYGADKVITFTGMREKGISDEAGARNCVDCWKQVIPYAEEKRVTLCLEHLNSRDNTHPMKGHPGYFGDHLDVCLDLIERVGSPRMKLLFDIYHVQIMHGDVIRRLRRCREAVAHIHTAGVPGRGELDDTQELHYPGVMRALIDLGFDGYVAHEFLPTWPDPIAALRHGVWVCDV